MVETVKYLLINDHGLTKNEDLFNVRQGPSQYDADTWREENSKHLYIEVFFLQIILLAGPLSNVSQEHRAPPQHESTAHEKLKNVNKKMDG